MAKYRKKPVVIDAIQWTGDNESENRVRQFYGDQAGLTRHHDVLLIETPEGVMTASIGDWIIKGVQGEFYPCKPDIFATTYEEVTDG